MTLDGVCKHQKLFWVSEVSVLHSTQKIPTINLHRNHDINVYLNVFLSGSSFTIHRAAGKEGGKIGIVHLAGMQNFPKKITNPLVHTRTCTYQGIRNVSFPKNFAYVVNGWSHRIANFPETTAEVYLEPCQISLM